MGEEIRQKCIELWKIQSWIVHHDNATAHASNLVLKVLAKNKTLILPQSLSSTDMAPADFFLFPKLKTPIKSKRFATIEETKKNSKQSCWRYQKACFRIILRDGKITVIYGRLIWRGQDSYR